MAEDFRRQQVFFVIAGAALEALDIVAVDVALEGEVSPAAPAAPGAYHPEHGSPSAALLNKNFVFPDDIRSRRAFESGQPPFSKRPTFKSTGGLYPIP
jgi:hypothetical protein